MNLNIYYSQTHTLTAHGKQQNTKVASMNEYHLGHPEHSGPAILLLSTKGLEIPSNTRFLLYIQSKGLLLSEAGLCWLVERSSSQVLWAT